MYEIVLTIPEETAEALNSSPTIIGDEVRLAAAIKLFEIGRLSSGAAAVLAGIPRPVFLAKLGEYGVNTFELTESELLEDVKNA